MKFYPFKKRGGAEKVLAMLKGGRGGTKPQTQHEFREDRSLRPPLSKKSFPVDRVGTKTASREAGFFFFFMVSYL